MQAGAVKLGASYFRSSTLSARQTQPVGNAGGKPLRGPLAAHPEPRIRETTAQEAAGGAMCQPLGPTLAAAGRVGLPPLPLTPRRTCTLYLLQVWHAVIQASAGDGVAADANEQQEQEQQAALPRRSALVVALAAAAGPWLASGAALAVSLRC